MAAPDLEPVRRFVGLDQGLAIVSTGRPDGSVQASVVNAGVLDRPRDGSPVVGFVAHGDAANSTSRARPRAAVTFRSGWEWVTVEGSAELAGPDDPLEGIDDEALRLLLREIFTSAGGAHNDFDEYDRVMAAERRTAVLVRPDRVYGVGV